ncbi:glycosyltransferase family 4 protein [Actinomarinicola tropica]|uniref:Glycosyltransferase n=1 Tax=Actinomarinicola tropica TaxID=2789776 RepID=A0A5Q2RQ72_9ACTN|nr:glycosyltransferase family 4 protein [Actinomarinicola tropica]QGG95355.1 glycosyltransferase [Actinomarinicola tropica]
MAHPLVPDQTNPTRSRDETLRDMAATADAAGLRRIHIATFRDRDHPEAGGSEEHATQVAHHLHLAGLEIVHHTGAVPGGPAELDRDGVRVVRRGGRLGVFATTVVDELSGRLGPRDGLVEVFHGVPFFSPLWARGPRVALIHHVHLGTWHHLLPFPGDRVGDAIERHVVPLLYRRATVVTAAASARDEIVDELRLPARNISVVPHGIDPRFRPGGSRSARPRVVAVARMMPQKGLADLVPILAAVRRRVPDLEAVIVGDGPQRPEIEQLRRDHDAEDWLELAGRVDDDELVVQYQQAWVAVSASHREGFGLTLTEAAACGTPAVATRIPGHVDAIAEGRSGRLAEGPDEMADALVSILTDPAERAALSRGALEWASSFTWAHSAAGVLDALVADARRRRTRRR